MNIVGIGVCGPNEKYLEATLKEFKRLCDHTVIVLNHATDKERKLIKKYGFESYEDNREWGKHQPRIKAKLLKYVGIYSPDWIVALDMDEVFDETVTRETLEELAELGGIAWKFYIVDLWNDFDHYYRGLSFWNVRYYKYTPEYGLDFLNRPVHCGLAPPMQYKWANDAGYILWHKGLMDPEDRQRKVERYKKYDPNAEYKADVYYQTLSSKEKPATIDREKLRAKLQEHMKGTTIKAGPRVLGKDQTEFVYIKREDGSTIDVPNTKVDKLLARNPEWKVLKEVSKTNTTNVDKKTTVNKKTNVDKKTTTRKRKKKT